MRAKIFQQRIRCQHTRIQNIDRKPSTISARKWKYRVFFTKQKLQRKVFYWKFFSKKKCAQMQLFVRKTFIWRECFRLYSHKIVNISSLSNWISFCKIRENCLWILIVVRWQTTRFPLFITAKKCTAHLMYTFLQHFQYVIWKVVLHVILWRVKITICLILYIFNSLNVLLRPSSNVIWLLYYVFQFVLAIRKSSLWKMLFR